MKIIGQILDNNMRPIAGANVREMIGQTQTSNVVATDSDGRFSITVQSGNSFLIMSHVAYDYDTIRASEFNSYYELWPASNLLDEVPVNTKPKTKEETPNWLIYGAVAVAALAVVYAINSGNSKPQPRKVEI